MICENYRLYGTMVCKCKARVPSSLRFIWGVPSLEISHKMMVYIWKPCENGWWLGVPPFQETPPFQYPCVKYINYGLIWNYGSYADPTGHDLVRMGRPVDSVNRCRISVAKNGRYNEIVTGSYFMVYKPTYIWGGPSCIYIYIMCIYIIIYTPQTR